VLVLSCGKAREEALGALHDPHGSGEARRPPGAEMLVAWAGIHRQEVAGDVGTASLS
jgi:hypothetical protein